MLSCDLCGTQSPRFVLDSPGLDGPLVECVKCGLRYVGTRRSALTFGDRKSTRLNSSHVEISYAVFCLKKKNEHNFCTTHTRYSCDIQANLSHTSCARH